MSSKTTTTTTTIFIKAFIKIFIFIKCLINLNIFIQIDNLKAEGDDKGVNRGGSNLIKYHLIPKDINPKNMNDFLIEMLQGNKLDENFNKRHNLNSSWQEVFNLNNFLNNNKLIFSISEDSTCHFNDSNGENGENIDSNGICGEHRFLIQNLSNSIIDTSKDTSEDTSKDTTMDTTMDTSKDTTMDTSKDVIIKILLEKGTLNCGGMYFIKNNGKKDQQIGILIKNENLKVLNMTENCYKSFIKYLLHSGLTNKSGYFITNLYFNDKIKLENINISFFGTEKELSYYDEEIIEEGEDEGEDEDEDEDDNKLKSKSKSLLRHFRIIEMMDDDDDGVMIKTNSWIVFKISKFTNGGKLLNLSKKEGKKYNADFKFMKYEDFINWIHNLSVKSYSNVKSDKQIEFVNFDSFLFSNSINELISLLPYTIFSSKDINSYYLSNRTFYSYLNMIPLGIFVIFLIFTIFFIIYFFMLRKVKSEVRNIEDIVLEIRGNDNLKNVL